MEMEAPLQTSVTKPMKHSFLVEVWVGVRQVVNKKFIADIFVTIIKETIKGFLLAFGGTLVHYARRDPSEISTNSAALANRTFGAPPPPPPPPPGYPGGSYAGSNAFNVQSAPPSTFGNFPR